MTLPLQLTHVTGRIQENVFTCLGDLGFFLGEVKLVNLRGGGGCCCQLPVAMHKKTYRHSGIEKMSGFLIGSCFFFEMLRGMVREIVVASSSWMIRNNYIWVFPKIMVPPNHPF